MKQFDQINHKMSVKTIQQVSQQLKLPKSTIRFWEKEFEGFVRPERSAGGQRRYSEHDLAALASIHTLRQQGLTLAQIKQRLMPGDHHKTALDVQAVDQLTERITRYVRKEIFNLLKHEP